jgi:hypothetical protein
VTSIGDMCGVITDQRAPPLFLAPGNIFLMAFSNPCPPSVKSVKAGHEKPVRAEPRVPVINCNGPSRIEKRVDNEFGASVATASKTKHIKLLPWRRLSALKIPLVKSPISTPVKLLTVPVFPPMLQASQQLKSNEIFCA